MNHLFTYIEHSGHFYFSFDLATGQFTYLNQLFRAFFKADENTTPAFVLSLVHPDDKEYVVARLQDVLAGASLGFVETRMVIAGKDYWMRIFPDLQKDENGAMQLTGMMQDCSSDKAHMNILQHHNTKKNAILNILAHDLSGPIAIIDSIADLLEAETADWKVNTVDKYVALISKTSKSCLQLIRDFTNQEFLESAAVKLQKSRVDLVAGLRTTVEEYRESRQELGKRFIFESPLSHLYLELDEDKFMQVIHNLISNSLKFTRENGIIKLTLEERAGKVLLIVSDNGIGIPEMFHQVLFEKFTAARRMGLNGEESIGLGMSIIKTIIEWHDGNITFESKEDVGTTFFIELPKD